MNKTFYFCFSFNKITLSEEIKQNLDISTIFNISLHKGPKKIGSTDTFQCVSNHKRQVRLTKIFIHLRMSNFNQNNKEVCQLRFNANLNNHHTLIGSKQFVMNNYIKAFQLYGSNCIALKFQIKDHYLVEYNVFLQSTDQALKMLLYEHFNAKIAEEYQEKKILSHLSKDSLDSFQEIVGDQILTINRTSSFNTSSLTNSKDASKNSKNSKKLQSPLQFKSSNLQSPVLSVEKVREFSRQGLAQKSLLRKKEKLSQFKTPPKSIKKTSQMKKSLQYPSSIVDLNLQLFPKASKVQVSKVYQVSIMPPAPTIKSIISGIREESVLDSIIQSVESNPHSQEYGKIFYTVHQNDLNDQKRFENGPALFKSFQSNQLLQSLEQIRKNSSKQEKKHQKQQKLQKKQKKIQKKQENEEKQMDFLNIQQHAKDKPVLKLISNIDDDEIQRLVRLQTKTNIQSILPSNLHHKQSEKETLVSKTFNFIKDNFQILIIILFSMILAIQYYKQHSLKPIGKTKKPSKAKNKTVKYQNTSQIFKTKK